MAQTLDCAIFHAPSARAFVPSVALEEACLAGF
jgi:hypothetical protein